LAKLKMGQFLSMTSYMNVQSFGRGDLVTVKNQHGHTMQMSKELLETMYSATHYKQVVPLNMTGLAELLQSVQDHVFTVNFKKQATKTLAAQILQEAEASDFTDSKKLTQLAKKLIQGEDCSLTCHMVEVENNLGRSLVIDLKATSDSKFRQVDHRTIESIIFKNVKYELKKGGKRFEDVDMEIPKDEPKWDATQLKVGDIFSGTSYYETVSELGKDEVLCYEKNFGDRTVSIDRSILRDECHNANVWDEEQQLSMTNLAGKLTEANNMCFQVCFNSKPNEKKIKELLGARKSGPKDTAEAKELAKECLEGSEVTLFGRLTKAEGKLGRSLVIDIPSQGFR